MAKFLLCVGAEKAGTTWLHRYFSNHPEYYDPGKELNVIQRDDFVPTFHGVDPFKKTLRVTLSSSNFAIRCPVISLIMRDPLKTSSAY